jgi:uncharacterized peroxidase-related enzyme
MSRFSQINPSNPPYKGSKNILDTIQKKIGKVPNIFTTMANAPSVLEGYAALSRSCESTSIPPQTRELIALTVSEANHCNYCLSAHSQIAKGLNLPESEIMNARHAIANDKKTAAFLNLAKNIVDKKGNITDVEIQEFKKQGLSDQEIMETVLIVTMTIFTNYFNHVADTPLDFPQAVPLQMSAAGAR